MTLVSLNLLYLKEFLDKLVKRDLTFYVLIVHFFVIQAKHVVRIFAFQNMESQG